MITPAYSLTATERILPKLALNFLSASLDPRVTFTRAGATATRVNSSGLIESVAADTARFDFDPTTLVCKGLLIEEQRTNFINYSNDFTSWSLGAASVVAASGTSPAGTNTAFSLITRVATSNQGIYQAATYGTGHTYSIYAKKDTANYLGITNNSGGGAYAVFDLNVGTVVSSSDCAATIQNAGNGWYRCIMENTSISGSYAIITVNEAVPASNPWESQAGTGKNILIWGFQLEAGEFPTSYIPTTSGSVTRNADVAVMTGTNFSSWWAATTGASAVKYIPSTISGTRPAFQFDDNTANNLICLRGNTTNPELYIKATSDQAQIDAGTIAANTTYTLAGAWNTNDCAAAINGNAAVTDNTATMPTVTQARLGSDGTNYLNGWLQTIRYWPQRITNAETQAFSK